LVQGLHPGTGLQAAASGIGLTKTTFILFTFIWTLNYFVKFFFPW